jgi:lipoprotein-anchoring transpeptidase ErfK/SrfK
VVRIRSRRPSRSAALIAPLVTAALAVAACSSTTHGSAQQRAAAANGSASRVAPAPRASSTSPAPVPKAVIAVNPAHATSYNPTAPVTVSATGGRLESVTLVNPEGKHVPGAISGGRWQASEVLGYGRTYRVTAVAVNADGVKTVKKSSFTTLTPNNMTLPYFDTVYGSAIIDKGTYGVGMIPVVHFDEAIPDRAAAERTLQVTTTPHVDGSWYWADDQDVHWRPESFYTPGTTVAITAKVYGKDLGNGLYGQSDESISFKIGPKRVSIADASTHQVKVYFGDKLVRTMPTSMGRGGTVPGKNGQTIYLWTMPGTYTVINHENPAVMSSDSYGLPANSPLGYAPEKVPWATKISTDGIYLHELDATVWAQGHENLSHGCLNLNYDNARWFYEHSTVGDVVKVVHSGGPEIQQWQGGDWSVPWSAWQAGSALH